MPQKTHLIVSALVRRDDSLLLIEQQGPWDPTPSWMLPGGRLEPGETLVAALRREFSEETGMRLAGTPTIAFAVEIEREGGVYSAITFVADAAGAPAPADPDGFVQRAEWVPVDVALERLACVGWYDCVPITRYLSGEAPPGTIYPVGDA